MLTIFFNEVPRKKIVNICDILMIIYTYSYVIVKYLFNYSIMKLGGA